MSAMVDVGGPPLDVQAYAASVCALIAILLGFVFFLKSYIGDSESNARLWRVNLKMAMLRVRRMRACKHVRMPAPLAKQARQQAPFRDAHAHAQGRQAAQPRSAHARVLARRPVWGPRRRC